MSAAFPWGRLVAQHASDLREQAPTQPKTRQQQRAAFDGPGTTSAVTLAVKPRQAAYKAGPGITINSKASRRDAEKRLGMRWSQI